jgi:hypothetical protein
MLLSRHLTVTVALARDRSVTDQGRSQDLFSGGGFTPSHPIPPFPPLPFLPLPSFPSFPLPSFLLPSRPFSSLHFIMGVRGYNPRKKFLKLEMHVGEF